MAKKITEVKVDNTSFNADHFAGWDEQKFIDHELASVPDKYGSREKKVEFLKKAHAQIQAAVAPDKTAKAK